VLLPNATHSWIGHFAGRLMQLQPTLSAVNAVCLAVERHNEARALAPREAADTFASDQASLPSAAYHVVFRSVRIR